MMFSFNFHYFCSFIIYVWSSITIYGHKKEYGRVQKGLLINLKKKISSKSATFALIRNQSLSRKLVIKHKMLYDLPEIELKCS